MQESISDYSQFNTVAKYSIRWMKATFVWLLISLFLVIFSIYSIVQYQFNTSIDFRGGTLIEVGFQDKSVNIPEIRKLLYNNGFESAQVQLFGENSAVINMSLNNQKTPDQLVASVKSTLTQVHKDIVFRRVESVGPKVGDELMKTSTIAVLVSIVAMLLYIWVRFELPFAVGSVIALVHDVIITLGFLAWFQIEFGLPIIAGLLTIVGYSMNDTVVIYDRIRENLIKYRRATKTDIIDLSINEVIIRTLVTSGTTLMSLVVLLIFGGEILRPFILTMTVGILVGTYSSIFVASPVLLFMRLKNNFSGSKLSNNK